MNTESLSAGGPASPARSLAVSRARTGRRILTDRWASRLVVVGGIIIIACILAILFVIGVEVYPLFKAPTVTFVGSYGTAVAGRGPAPGDAIGVDEYRRSPTPHVPRQSRVRSPEGGRTSPPSPCPAWAARRSLRGRAGKTRLVRRLTAGPSRST
jgi:hypothetical protein